MPSRFESEWNDYVITPANRAFGVSVTLKRNGAAETASFTARRGEYEYEEVDESNLLTRVTARTFQFAIADVVVGGAEVEPRRGDIITEGTDRYEVLPLGGEPAVEKVPGDVEWLVRTKRVS